MPDKVDKRMLVVVDTKSSFGDPNFRVTATVVHVDDQGVVRSPHWSYEADGFAEYEFLSVDAYIPVWRGQTDSQLSTHAPSFRDCYSVTVDRAEMMVKVLRRLERHLERARDRYGSTDYAGTVARIAAAVGAKGEQPVGIYERGGNFAATGTDYRWMNTDSLRDYLITRAAAWKADHHLSDKEAA